MHEPLSQSLARILGEYSADTPLTLNDLLARTEGRGLYLVIILLAVPFVPLISPPGLSGILGLIIFGLSLSLAVGAKPQMPRCIGARPLPADLRQQLLDFLREQKTSKPRPPANFKQWLLRWSVKFLRFIERWSRPRRTAWMNWRLARSVNALLLALLAFLLALPLPSAPFFPTNGLPAYAIILIATSMMEQDGVLIWVGYGLSLATVLFFASIAGTIIEIVQKIFPS